MRFRTTLLLILILLGLGAYVYWVEVPKAEEEAKRKTLFDFKADDVTAMSLVYTDREIAVEKAGDAWKLTKPIEAAADSITVRNLINAIAECEVKKELTEVSEDRAQYGLDAPLVKIAVQLGDRALPEIRVGKATPVGASAYVERGGADEIVLTSSAFRTSVDKQVKDLRDKTIVTFEDDDVHAIALRGEDKEIQLVRTDGAWRLEQPGSWPADAVSVRSFLSTLRSMRATDFPADSPADLSPYGLDAPRLSVILTLGEAKAETRILLGKAGEQNDLYVQTSGAPVVFAVSDWIFRDLNKTAADFRDKTLLAFDRDAVVALAVTPKDGEPFTLVRGDDHAWRVEGQEEKLSETAVTQVINELHQLKGYEIAADHPSDPSLFGLDAPQLRFSLSGAGGKPIGTILLAPRPGDEGKNEYVGMAEGGPTVFLVRDYVITRLNKKADDFVEKPAAAGEVPAPEMIDPHFHDHGHDDADFGDQD